MDFKDKLVSMNNKEKAMTLLKMHYASQPGIKIASDPAYQYFYIVDTINKKITKVNSTFSSREISLTKWKSYLGKLDMRIIRMFNKTFYFNMDTFKLYTSRYDFLDTGDFELKKERLTTGVTKSWIYDK